MNLGDTYCAMKAQGRYPKSVRWNAEDRAYVGYCPGLFPWGGVCHGATEEATYRKLCLLVREEAVQLSRIRRKPPS